MLQKTPLPDLECFSFQLLGAATIRFGSLRRLTPEQAAAILRHFKDRFGVRDGSGVLCLHARPSPWDERGAVVNDCQIHAPAPPSHVTSPHRPDPCHEVTCHATLTATKTHSELPQRLWTQMLF